MFWGVTLDSGKRYTQTVEKSFHLSMATLGFQNCSSIPVTVMIEVDKAQFALCTLQPGKIPQQPLDYCFTEGEEVTFFTEGPGDVHLTGYLMDEPNALEFEEDEDELSADSEESLESASDSSNSESEDEDESLSDEITLGNLLQSGEIGNDNDDEEEDDEESGDDDWDPSKDNPKRKKRNRKDKKKRNSKKEQNDDTTGKKAKQTEGLQQSLNLMSNMHGEGDDDDDESWTPQEKVETENKAMRKAASKKNANEKKKQNDTFESKEVQTSVTLKKKAKKKVPDNIDDEKKKQNDTFESKEVQTEPLKKKAKKKVPDKNREVEREENGSTLDNDYSESHNSLNSPANTLNSPQSSRKKEHGKPQNQTELPQGNLEKKKNQSQAMETKKRKLPGGIVLEDLMKGEGPLAKKGQMVHVYYKGNLAQNKKQFDACLSGPPFSFRLGTGEVIRGWDVGVAGMQVGGKRRLTVPPLQGYGKQKKGPIPPNSTLEFEIQLVQLQ